MAAPLLIPIKNGTSHKDGDFTWPALLTTVDFASIRILDHLPQFHNTADINIAVLEW